MPPFARSAWRGIPRTRVCAALSAILLGAAGADAAERDDRSHIVLGYMQASGNGADSAMRQYRWQALTHVAVPFTSFDDTGTITNSSSWINRDAELKPGGAASNNGVKVLMTLAPTSGGGFNLSHITTVMGSETLQDTLISNIIPLVSHPTYGCDGVTLDLEPFSWGASTRTALTRFVQQLNAQLKALDPPRELSIYVAATYDSALNGDFDYPAIRDHVDYLIYSGYDFSGGALRAVGIYGNPATYSIIRNLDAYLDPARGQMPPEKMVLALPLYGRQYSVTKATEPVYGDTATEGASAGWTESVFASSYQNPPYTRHASGATHYVKYYSEPTGASTWNSVVFDDNETLEYKLRLAKAWKGAYETGRQLRGVAFWSLNWLAQGKGTTSRDPNDASRTGLRRTNDGPWTLWEELFMPPGEQIYRAETFENLTINPRWVDPNLGPDDIGVAAATSVAMASAPAGAPAGSQRVAAINFQFTATPNNRFLFKHEVLADASSGNPIDHNCHLVQVDATTKFMADLHVPAAYPNLQVRMVVKDGDNELERGPAYTFSTAGWQRIEFDLTQSGTVSAYDTNGEADYLDGDGVIDTAGGGARDIAFVGFEVTNGGQAGSGTLNIDQILYTHAYPDGKKYVINEFRYATAAQQFVEIHGPAGVMPSGLVLRIVDGADGSIAATIPLGGNTIPASGLYLLGASGLSGVRDQALTDGILQNTDGTVEALQLFDTATGTVHDAVVYQAFAGLGQLDGPGDPIVTERGPGWFGGISNGKTATGELYTAGRYPDGADTGLQSRDFSSMPATPGAPNGGSVSLGVTYDFETPPPYAFETFKNFAVTPAASIPGAVGPSPSGGAVHRCVDTAGGGSLSWFGDAALGADGNGYNVTGEVFVPANGTSSDAHATGLGICVRSGTNFFGTDNRAGYDSGYWLIYENASGVGLADGQDDHPGVLHFVWAHNEGGSVAPTTLLASVPLASTGVTPGSWTTFRLSINPGASGDKLLAVLNGTTIYSGPIPEGGPTSGAFVVGYRENHTGAPQAYEGTWIDNITIDGATVPVEVSGFSVE